MQVTSEVLTIKDSRGFTWLILAVFFAAGIVMIIQGALGTGLFFMAMSGGIFLAIGPGDVTTFDPVRATILIKQRSFFRPTVLTEIPFDNIVSVMVEQHRGSKGRIFGLVVLVDQAGQHIPIRPSAGLLWCENQARQISVLLSARGRAVPVVEASARREVQEGTSDGIAWRLETLHPAVERSVTRWFSAAAPLPGQSIVLCQIPPGMSSPSGSIMNASKRFSGFISVYLDPLQLDSSERTWLENATYIHDLEPRLQRYFLVAGSSAGTVHGALAPGLVDLLVTFAEQHPVGHIMTFSPDELTPLTVLISPNGLWVMCQGVIADPAKIEELVGLGVALVQAQLEIHARQI